MSEVCERRRTVSQIEPTVTEMAAAQLDLGAVLGAESPEMGLPIANAENKKLQAEVRRKEREMAELQRQAAHLQDRVQAMGDHLKNVQQELQQTQVHQLEFRVYSAKSSDCS